METRVHKKRGDRRRHAPKIICLLRDRPSDARKLRRVGGRVNMTLRPTSRIEGGVNPERYRTGAFEATGRSVFMKVSYLFRF
jgi:hypothetical protein